MDFSDLNSKMLFKFDLRFYMQSIESHINQGDFSAAITTIQTTLRILECRMESTTITKGERTLQRYLKDIFQIFQVIGIPKTVSIFSISLKEMERAAERLSKDEVLDLKKDLLSADLIHTATAEHLPLTLSSFNYEKHIEKTYRQIKGYSGAWKDIFKTKRNEKDRYLLFIEILRLIQEGKAFLKGENKLWIP